VPSVKARTEQEKSPAAVETAGAFMIQQKKMLF
jgi:hypothetical protein